MKAATYFGERVAGYDAHYDARTADGHALRARLAAVLELLGDGAGSVLDVGMGPGRLCIELAGRGWTVSGADAAEEMVEAVRSRLPEAASRLVRAEIEALPFEPASFDAVVATGVLEYADLPRALSELARAVRPGGLVVVSYPNPRALYGVWKSWVWYRAVRGAKRALRRPGARYPRGGRPLPPERFKERLAAAGLAVTAVRHASYLVLPTPLDMLAPRLTARVGERLEGSGPLAARLLATQVVYAARKPP